MRVGMSSRHLRSFQGVSLQGGSNVGAGRPLRVKFRPSATSISKYKDTWETLNTQSSRQETSQLPWSEEWNGKIVNSPTVLVSFFKNLQITYLPEGLSSEHICSASSFTPCDPSSILSGFQPCNWPLWIRIWTTAEIRSCRNYSERENGQCRVPKLHPKSETLFIFFYWLHSPVLPAHMWQPLLTLLHTGTWPWREVPVLLQCLAGRLQEK